MGLRGYGISPDDLASADKAETFVIPVRRDPRDEAKERNDFRFEQLCRHIMHCTRFAVSPDRAVSSGKEMHIQRAQQMVEGQKRKPGNDKRGNDEDDSDEADGDGRGISEHKQTGDACEMGKRESDGKSRNRTGENENRSHEISPLMVDTLILDAIRGNVNSLWKYYYRNIGLAFFTWKYQGHFR